VRSVFISLRKEETGLVGKSDDEAKQLLKEMKVKSREALMRNLELSIFEEDNSDKGHKRLKSHVQVERILEEMQDDCPSLQKRLINANDADRKANVRANETHEKQERLERDASNKASARERAKIINNQPTCNTKMMSLPQRHCSIQKMVLWKSQCI